MCADPEPVVMTVSFASQGTVAPTDLDGVNPTFLVTPHGGVFVFLQLRPGTVQFGFDCRARPGYLFFERLVPADGNHRRNNHNFSQESHNF